MEALLRKYAIGLFCFELMLVATHFAFGELRFFNLDREYNLPSWFSGVQLAAIGMTCVAAFHNERVESRGRWIWWVLAGGFFYLSFDEIMVVHEGLLREETLDSIPGTSMLRGLPPWQVVFAPLAVIAAIIFAFFFKSRFPLESNRWISLAGGFAFWGIAFALEGTAMGFFIPRGWYQQEVALEEFCEMAGATLLLWTFAGFSLQCAGSVVSNAAAQEKRRRISFSWVFPIVLLVILPAVFIFALNSYQKENVHISSGMRFLEDKKYQEAIDAFNLALEENPDNLKVLRALGRAAYWSGNLDLAEETYLKASRLAPDDRSIRNGLSLLKTKRKLAQKNNK
ncbi:MAG: tetratricopeptide repeat protein [Gammaproteobacteria bacterium]